MEKKVEKIMDKLTEDCQKCGLSTNLRHFECECVCEVCGMRMYDCMVLREHPWICHQILDTTEE